MLMKGWSGFSPDLRATPREGLDVTRDMARPGPSPFLLHHGPACGQVGSSFPSCVRAGGRIHLTPSVLGPGTAPDVTSSGTVPGPELSVSAIKPSRFADQGLTQWNS